MDSSKVRYYEIAYILDPQLDEDQQRAIIQRYSDLVTGRGGSVDYIDRWERRRLAYEIQGKREGYYVFMNITADPETEAEINRLMKLSEGVIRHLIIRRKHPMIPPPEEVLAEGAEVAAPAEAAPAAPEAAPAEAAPEPAAEAPAASETVPAPAAEATPPESKVALEAAAIGEAGEATANPEEASKA